MDGIFLEFDRIYATGQPSESFEETYAAIYEACCEKDGKTILETRLTRFYQRKLFELLDQCNLNSCDHINTWLLGLLNYTVITRELSDLLLYYNRFSKTHSLNLGYYILASHLLDVEFTSNTDSASEPLSAISQREGAADSYVYNQIDDESATATLMSEPILGDSTSTQKRRRSSWSGAGDENFSTVRTSRLERGPVLSDQLVDWLRSSSDACGEEIFPLNQFTLKGIRPYLWTMCHSHKCAKCLSLLGALTRNMTLVMRNWPDAFLIVYTSYLVSEWRALRRALVQGRTRRRFDNDQMKFDRHMHKRRVRQSAIDLRRAMVKPVADRMCDSDPSTLCRSEMSRGIIPRSGLFNFANQNLSHLECYVGWFMTKTSRARALEMCFAQEFDFSQSLNRVIDEVWSETLTRGAEKLIKVIDWASPTKRKLVRKGISWFSLSIKSWIELSSHLRLKVLNAMLDDALVTDDNIGGTCLCSNVESSVVSKLINLRALKSLSNIPPYRSLLTQTIEDYFTTFIEPAAQSIVVKLLIEAVTELGASRASSSPILREFKSFIKLGAKGRLQRRLIDSILFMDSNFRAQPLTLPSYKESFLEFLNDISDVKELIERINIVDVVPGRIRLITIPRFYHKRPRLMRNVPSAASQIRKFLVDMTFEKSRTLELVLDFGKCEFHSREGLRIECSTGAGIILDCWNYLLETETDDKPLEKLRTATELSPEVFDIYLSEISQYIQISSQTTSLHELNCNLIKISDTDHEDSKPVTSPATNADDFNRLAVLDCNLASLFKNRKDDWLSESEIMTDILLNHPKHFGIQIETFRHRLSVLIQKEVIESKFQLYRWNSI